jgi:hypothetical protein
MEQLPAEPFAQPAAGLIAGTLEPVAARGEILGPPVFSVLPAADTDANPANGAGASIIRP